MTWQRPFGARCAGRGAYALVVMTKREPGKIVAVRKISPLVVGLGDGETYPRLRHPRHRSTIPVTS